MNLMDEFDLRFHFTEICGFRFPKYQAPLIGGTNAWLLLDAFPFGKTEFVMANSGRCATPAIMT